MQRRNNNMEKLIEAFMESPEVGFVLLKTMIEKYKPMAYEVANIIEDIYRDYSNNTEHPALVARVKKNMYDAYVDAGFTEDQALALMINDNIQLMERIQRQASRANTKKDN